jgi:hypothetical protein
VPVERAASASAERPAAVNGSLYAVVSPTYTAPTQSFLRLFNGSNATATFTVTMIGSSSGRNYGTATIQVPAKASPQYTVMTTGTGDTTSIQVRAGAASLDAADSSYSLYIQSTEQTAGYQHVTYNGDNNFFENNSICKYLLNANMTPSNYLVLNNVHTTQLAGNQFPSKITLYNYWNDAVTYNISLVDSVTGTALGSFNVNAAANSVYEFPASTLQSSANFTPTASQIHMNVYIFDAAGSPPAMVGQSIINAGLQNAQINMSTACAVNAPVSSSGGVSGGIGW